MFKNLLLKLANKIINKYGIHIINKDSIIQMYDTRFRIESYSITKSLYYETTLNLTGVDILKDLKLTANE